MAHQRALEPLAGARPGAVDRQRELRGTGQQQPGDVRQLVVGAAAREVVELVGEHVAQLVTAGRVERRRPGGEPSPRVLLDAFGQPGAVDEHRAVGAHPQH